MNAHDRVEPAPKCRGIKAHRRLFGVQPLQNLNIQLVNLPHGCDERSPEVRTRHSQPQGFERSERFFCQSMCCREIAEVMVQPVPVRPARDASPF